MPGAKVRRRRALWFSGAGRYGSVVTGAMVQRRLALWFSGAWRYGLALLGAMVQRCQALWFSGCAGWYIHFGEVPCHSDVGGVHELFGGCP